MTPILEALIVGIGTFFAFNLWLIFVPWLIVQHKYTRLQIITLELCAVASATIAGLHAI